MPRWWRAPGGAAAPGRRSSCWERTASRCRATPAAPGSSSCPPPSNLRSRADATPAPRRLTVPVVGTDIFASPYPGSSVFPGGREDDLRPPVQRPVLLPARLDRDRRLVAVGLQRPLVHQLKRTALPMGPLRGKPVVHVPVDHVEPLAADLDAALREADVAQQPLQLTGVEAGPSPLQTRSQACEQLALPAPALIEIPNHERLRATFNQAADLYDRARPQATRRRCSTTWRSWRGSAQAAGCWRSAQGPGRPPCRWPSAAATSSPSSWARTWRPSPGRISKRYLTEL